MRLLCVVIMLWRCGAKVCDGGFGANFVNLFKNSLKNLCFSANFFSKPTPKAAAQGRGL